jgi:hypothetical protein
MHDDYYSAVEIAKRWKTVDPRDARKNGEIIPHPKKKAPPTGKQQAENAEPKPLTATPWIWRDPKIIPPREFLYGKHYIRKFVSVGFAHQEAANHRSA